MKSLQKDVSVQIVPTHSLTHIQSLTIVKIYTLMELHES